MFCNLADIMCHFCGRAFSARAVYVQIEEKEEHCSLHLVDITEPAVSMFCIMDCQKR